MQFFYHCLFAIIEYIIVLIITHGLNIINYEYISIKYSTFKFRMSKDEPIGANMIIKIIFPTIYIILISGILYNIKQEWIIKDVFYITIYFYSIRWIIICILNRTLLYDWKSELICLTLALLLSLGAYNFFIIKTNQIFPSLEEIRDGIWIGIITFFASFIIKYIYEFSKENSGKAINRRKEYILKKYTSLYIKYNKCIEAESQELRHLIFSIMIYENYNRPPVIRILENIKFLLIKKGTLGVMQVSTRKMMSNKESAQEGAKIIKKLYDKYISKKEGNIEDVIINYNRSENYVQEVMFIFNLIEEENL